MSGVIQKLHFGRAGADKSDRLAEIEAQIASGVPKLLMAHVQPTWGRLVWLVDTDASSKLKGTDS